MFREKLELAASRNDSLLCVGLDPFVPDIVADMEQVLPLNLLIIEATRDLACAYKPNLAIYDAMERGEEILRRTLQAIPEWIPKIGDAKRCDIGPCGEACMRTLFEKWNFDAATVYPYMGLDAVKPFLQNKDKAALVLCRTSNESAPTFQDLLVVRGTGGKQRPFYLEVAAVARGWNEQHGNVGLVVGATYPDEIAQVRRLCPDMLFLIPGVGAQGGDLKAAVQAARDDQGAGFIINVSRQIMNCALSPEGDLLPERQARKAVRQEAERLRADINVYRSVGVSPTPRQPAVPV
jgi:orotidine 5'-phosphate decarboxylase subfamily 2